MRISDLSSKTGIPIATIKFYLREGLLPPGTRTGRNQARYGEVHRRRLLLIRALTGVGRLDLTSVRAVLAAVDDVGLAVPALHEVVHGVLFPVEQSSVQSANLVGADADVDRFLAGLGWDVRSDAPGRVWLALVVATLRDLDCACDIDFFEPYARAARRIAAQELDLVSAEDLDGAGDGAPLMVRSILLGVAFSAMRLLAEEQEIKHGLARSGPGRRK